MGIRFLQTAIQQSISGGYISVDITKEVETWKKNHPGQRPVIVLDVLSLMNKFSLDEEVLCGGRHQIASAIARKLFTKFKDLDVEVVSFVDGDTTEDKRRTWLSRQNDRYEVLSHVFDSLYAGKSTKEIIENHKIPNLSTFLSCFLSIVQEHSECFTSDFIECDLEIAAYATNKNALAIITSDTDFMIFEGNWKIWSSRDFDLNNFTTFEYNREAFLKHFNLTQVQLPMFASLCSNDILPYFKVKKFHLTLTNNSRDRFAAIAKFISNYDWRNGLTDSLLKKISNYVSCKNTTVHFLELKRSCESYNINSKRPPISKYQHQNRILKSVVNRTSINKTPYFFDMRQNDMPSYFALTEELFRKTAGVEMYNLDKKRIKMKVWIKKLHGRPFESVDLEPIYPPDDLGRQLKQNQNTETEKWDLLVWILDLPYLTKETLTKLPDDIRIDCITIFWMVDKKCLKYNEADILLLAMYRVRNHMVPDTLDCPSHLNAKAVRNAHLFCKLYHYMISAFLACGVPVEENLIDSVYYQHLCLSIQDCVCLKSQADYKNLELYRLYSS